MQLWSARLVWALLPLTAGDAVADLISNWETGTARVAAVLLWAAWVIGLIALLAPRPWGVTVLLVVAPTAVGVTAAAALDASSASGVVAIASAVVAAILALSSPVAEAAGNALAYGDERRFPLRIPTPLLIGPVPFAILLVAGASVGPMFVANGDMVVGVVLTVVLVPVAVALVRALHRLSVRWIVLVPAGLVVADPLTIDDPVLVRREQIANLGDVVPAAAESVDLRLGTRAGTVALTTLEPITLARRNGRSVALVHTSVVLVAPVRKAALLAAARERRIPVA